MNFDAWIPDKYLIQNLKRSSINFHWNSLAARHNLAPKTPKEGLCHSSIFSGHSSLVPNGWRGGSIWLSSLALAAPVENESISAVTALLWGSWLSNSTDSYDLDWKFSFGFGVLFHFFIVVKRGSSGWTTFFLLQMTRILLRILVICKMLKHDLLPLAKRLADTTTFWTRIQMFG